MSLAAGPRAGTAAVRELLALQASDWAFMVSAGERAPYARERFDGHRQALARALAGAQPDEDAGAAQSGRVCRSPALFAS